MKIKFLIRKPGTKGIQENIKIKIPDYAGLLVSFGIDAGVFSI
jgi:hypothetical protein